MMSLPGFATRSSFRVPMFVTIVFIHLLALAAPFTFTWTGFISFWILVFATGCLGITLCYHRLLSHKSFKTHRWVKYFLMLCGTLSMEGDPTWWVCTHRLHHKESDQPGDPHSPSVGFAWAHVLWLIFDDKRLTNPKIMNQYAPELASDPWAKFLAKNFLSVNLVFIGLLTVAGYYFGGSRLAWSMFAWAGALRVVWVWHITWFVNSVTHIYGYRNYETKDTSKNIWWVALLTFGEGWHNNHHANPSAAKSGHKWWEFDLTYCVIKLLKWTGMAWQIHPVVLSGAPKPTDQGSSKKMSVAAS
jgi:fatty-acid desaturase